MRPVAPLPRAIFLVGVIAVLSATLAFRAAFANGNEKALKAQAEALLAKSHDLSNIEAEGSPAFVLSARIRYQMGTQVGDGTGQITWLAPDHYRAQYFAPSYAYSEIVRDGYQYLTRTQDVTPPLIYELKLTFDAAIRGVPEAAQKIKKVETVPSGGDTLTCITFKSENVWTECLDGDGDLVTREQDAPRAMAALDHRYEFSNFVSFGAKRFPQQMIFRGGDGHTITVVLQGLALADHVSADQFAVPSHSAMEPWCAEPTLDTNKPLLFLRGSTDPDSLVAAMGRLRDARAAVYFVINAAGHLRGGTVIFSSKQVADKDLEMWMNNVTFPVLRCGDNALEYQTETSFAR
jgi:hypothetical protein